MHKRGLVRFGTLCTIFYLFQRWNIMTNLYLWAFLGWGSYFYGKKYLKSRGEEGLVLHRTFDRVEILTAWCLKQDTSSMFWPDDTQCQRVVYDDLKRQKIHCKTIFLRTLSRQMFYWSDKLCANLSK